MAQQSRLPVPFPEDAWDAELNGGEARFQAAREEQLIVQALREQDEAAFELVLDRYYSAMLRLAMVYVRSRACAEEVVQETWLAVLAGIQRFEGRSSLKTWIFRILVNRAKTYATRDREAWDSAQNPEDWILSQELGQQIEKAIEQLPANQREVIVLRDVEGWTAAEVCNALNLSETNQRVLLHRARVKVRDALERYLAEPEDDEHGRTTDL